MQNGSIFSAFNMFKSSICGAAQVVYTIWMHKRWPFHWRLWFDHVWV